MPLTNPFPAFHVRWSNRHWAAVLAVAIVAWLIYATLGPGLDFFGCYSWMVKTPERLAEIPKVPWTFNPPWLASFMAPFATMPGRSGYILFQAATIAMILYGVHAFGGKPILTLLSAHMFWILWWGQVEGWAVLGLVLGWIAFQRKSWPIMLLSLVLSSLKPQIGFVPTLALWWGSGPGRWKSMAAFVALLPLSIWIWGPWPVWYLQGIFGFLGSGSHNPWNASLGFIALPFFVPALLAPLTPTQRLLAIAATAQVASPYLPYYSTILLLCFEIPWWGYLFGFLGYLPGLLTTTVAWNGIVFLPITILVWLYLPWIRANWQRYHQARPVPSP